jgi:transketolase
MRLASLMGIRSLFVMTHDSIGLGEDGPTHQPVEHLAAMRAIPNHLVFRPADATETAECWQAAIHSEKAPSTLVLTRQDLRAVRTEYVAENLSAKGAYELAAAEGGDAKVTIFASGSEVEIALDARDLLQKDGTPTRVVSVPCFELFEEQDKAYREKVLGNAPVKIAVEAALRFGWDRFVGSDGAFVGMTGFGASAPAKDLYKYFGITAEAVANIAGERVKNGVPKGEDARAIPKSEPARPHP